VVRTAIVAALAAGLVLGPTGCRYVRDEPADYTSRTFEALTTHIGLTIPTKDVPARVGEVQQAFARVAEELNEWRPGTPLANVNKAAGRHAVEVPPALLEVVATGLALGRLTDGAFDITWASLWGLWDFRAADPVIPEAAEIARRTALIGYDRVVLDQDAGTLRLPTAGMKIGLGGIAKGYALVRSGAALREAGVRSGLVSAGGQVLAMGDKAGRPWRVGIRDPRGAADEPFVVLHVRDTSVSTSGDYERFFVKDGVRYHHILDPRTGRPARGLRSATVVTADPTRADALSTALMVMGKDKGLALIGRLPDVEALVVDDAGRVHQSEGMAGHVAIVKKPRP